MTYEEKLRELVAKDERIIVMTAENRGALRTLPPELGERFIDTGITEQTMIGMAAGLALRGRRPVTHALATFLTMRAFEFIRTDVGIAGLPVKLVGAVPGFLSEANGATHQAIEDVSIMRGIPKMQVLCPADAEELPDALEAMMASEAPAYLRFNARPSVVPHNEKFQIAKAEVLSTGSDVALLTYGTLVTEAWEAKGLLEAAGVSVRLLNVRSLKPIDETAVISAMKECRLTVALEDHFEVGGLYSILGELSLKHRLAPNVVGLNLGEKWFQPCLLKDVLEHEGFTGPQIAKRVMANL